MSGTHGTRTTGSSLLMPFEEIESSRWKASQGVGSYGGKKLGSLPRHSPDAPDIMVVLK